LIDRNQFNLPYSARLNRYQYETSGLIAGVAGFRVVARFGGFIVAASHGSFGVALAAMPSKIIVV
jgi:hypothetical protein